MGGYWPEAALCESQPGFTFWLQLLRNTALGMILLPGLGPKANNSRRISTIIATAILAQCVHMAVREFYLL